jgi:hypothetical protein
MGSVPLLFLLFAAFGLPGWAARHGHVGWATFALLNAVVIGVGCVGAHRMSEARRTTGG